VRVFVKDRLKAPRVRVFENTLPVWLPAELGPDHFDNLSVIEEGYEGSSRLRGDIP
jgi:hypothetical protein